MAATKLPRELLKWIQSLDLAFSVKNIKRDFANGFLVAEMFSRYDSKNVTMHSFDTGSSTKARRGNWGLLKKYFRRKGYDAQLGEQAIEDVIVCKTGAAVALLITIYTLLTGREVREPVRPAPSPSARAPAYASNTASEVLRGATREAASLVGSKEKEAKMQQALGVHHMDQQRLRDENPERFAPSQGLTKVLRGRQRQMGTDVASPKIAVKTITVKHINTNVTQLRAGKELAARSPMGGTAGGAARGFGQGGMSPTYGQMSEQTPLLSLDDVVQAAVQGSDATEDAVAAVVGSAAPAETFATALEHGSLSESLMVAVFDEMNRQAADLGIACTSSTGAGVEQLQIIARILVGALDAGRPTGTDAVFESAASALEALGVAMQASDSAAATSMYGAALQAPIALLLRCSATKRATLVRIIGAFHGSAAIGRIEAVRALKLALVDDTAALVQCLSIALAAEESGALADMPVLLELHTYYYMLGLRLQGAECAAAAAGLRLVASHAPAIARTVADQLLKVGLRGEESWEARAQVLMLCTELLTPPRSGARVSGPESEAASTSTWHQQQEEDTLRYAALQMFDVDADETVKCLGLAHFPFAMSADAPHLQTCAPAVRSNLFECYMEVLFSLAAPMRATMLSWGSEFSLNAGGGDVDTAVPALAAQWTDAGIGAEIVRAVGERIAQGAQDGIESAQLLVILQAIVAGSEREGGLASEAWGAAFAGGERQLEDYVFIALCDAECCEVAAEVVQRCVFASQRLRQQFLGSRSLVGAFQLLFRGDGSGDAFCQSTACAFLTGLLEDAPRGSEIVLDVSEFVAALTSAPGLVPSPALESLFKLAASM